MRIVGEKINLESIRYEDTPLVVKWRNLESVRANFIFQDTFTDEIHNNWMKTKVETGEVVQFIIKEADTERPIGSVYLRDIDKKNQKAEFGIFIGEEDNRGKGYGQESAKMICEYAFRELNLHKVMLRVFADNVNAIKSYKNAGFVEEAYLKDEIFQQGAFRDLVLMAIFNAEHK